MNDKKTPKIKDEFKSFTFGNYKIRFRKKVFKYVFIAIIIIFVGYPYLNLNIPTHFLTQSKDLKQLK